MVDHVSLVIFRCSLPAKARPLPNPLLPLTPLENYDAAKCFFLLSDLLFDLSFFSRKVTPEVN